MLLAVDIGNTAIKLGLFDGDTLTEKFSVPTDRNVSADEIAQAAGDLLRQFESAIVCSVVPEIDAAVREVLTRTSADVVFIGNSFDFGLKVNYEPLESLGTDRLVAAFAAVEKYGAPCIVCSLGTATTIDVVNEHQEFLGGLIGPGLEAMAQALHIKTSKLPSVEITKPEKVAGNSTVDAIRSGVYNGYVAMVEGLITRMRGESGVSMVIATGGNASRVSTELDRTMTVDPDLVLVGLQILASRR